MRGIKTTRSKKAVEDKKDKKYQEKFYLIVAGVTIFLFVLVYLVYSRM